MCLNEASATRFTFLVEIGIIEFPSGAPKTLYFYWPSYQDNLNEYPKIFSKRGTHLSSFVGDTPEQFSSNSNSKQMARPPPPTTWKSDRRWLVSRVIFHFLEGGKTVFHHGIISVVLVLHTPNSVKREPFVNLSSIDPFEPPIQKGSHLLQYRYRKRTPYG